MHATDMIEEIVNSVMEILTDKYKFATILHSDIREDIETNLIGDVGSELKDIEDKLVEHEEMEDTLEQIRDLV